MRRRRRVAFPLFLILFVALSAIVYLRAFPLVQKLGRTRVTNDAAAAINSAVSDQIDEDGLTYESIVLMEKDVSGNLTALRTDMAALNRLRTGVLRKLDQYFAELRHTRFGIPLGSVIAPTFFAGTGPELPLRLTSVNTSSATFSSRFSQAGINQTRHEILLHVVMDMTLISAFGASSFSTEYDVIVADTIVIGSVPTTFVET